MTAGNRKIVTIDGLASSGKSSASRLLAERLDFFCLDTGAIYRAVSWLALSKQAKFENQEVVELIKSSTFELVDARIATEDKNIVVNGISLGNKELRNSEVTDASSKVGSLVDVRRALVELQRQAFPNNNIVAEGRDIGTVIFPSAEVKFFLISSPELRAGRRIKEMTEKGLLPPNSDPKLLELELQKAIQDRDNRDVNREFCPTVPAPNAIVVDNSGKSLTQVVDTMYVHAAKILGLST